MNNKKVKLDGVSGRITECTHMKDKMSKRGVREDSKKEVREREGD